MESLPTELLISIGEYVSYKAAGHVETLCSLARCSRRFHAVYQLLIYRHISPTNYWSIHTIHLIQRIWRDPDLAAQVRHLDFGWMIKGDLLQGHSDVFDVTSATSFIDAALEEIFEPGERRSKSMWRYHLLTPSKEAWLSLLLVRLTHLQSIEFNHPWSDLLTELLCKAARRQRPFHQNTPFPCLEAVKADVLRKGDALINANIDSLFLIPFFFFPAVRKITGGPVPGYFCFSQDEPPFLDVRPYDDLLSFNVNHSCRPVREIIITKAWWCHGMVEWLAACKNLEHLRIKFLFDWHAWYSVVEDTDDAKLNARKFRRALLPFVGTLKTLDIEVTIRRDYTLYTIMDDAGTFGSLREFTVLENLRITHYLLARISTVDSAPFMMRNKLADILPSSLKDLEILAVTADLYLGLIFEVMLLIADRASMPQLERVRVQLALHPDGERRKPLIPWCIDISVERLVPMESDDARERINTVVKVEMTSKLPAVLMSSNPDEISRARELVHLIRMLLNEAGLKDNGVCHCHEWEEPHELESETPSP
ncbi:unnamed protein product [Penicillium salamii]|nr:unnamed protein product [Penicillium salamii]CAG8397993.1 unnamed protein product [Penicillium salamii]